MTHRLSQYQQVEEVLREIFEARGNDIIMSRNVCERFYPELVKEIEGKNYYAEGYLKKSESFTRHRREIQAEGRYLPPEDIVRIRKSEQHRISSEHIERKEPKVFNNQYVLL